MRSYANEQLTTVEGCEPLTSILENEEKTKMLFSSTVRSLLLAAPLLLALICKFTFLLLQMLQ